MILTLSPEHLALSRGELNIVVQIAARGGVADTTAQAAFWAGIRANRAGILLKLIEKKGLIQGRKYGTNGAGYKTRWQLCLERN